MGKIIGMDIMVADIGMMEIMVADIGMMDIKVADIGMIDIMVADIEMMDIMEVGMVGAYGRQAQQDLHLVLGVESYAIMGRCNLGLIGGCMAPQSLRVLIRTREDTEGLEERL